MMRDVCAREYFGLWWFVGCKHRSATRCHLLCLEDLEATRRRNKRKILEKFQVLWLSWEQLKDIRLPSLREATRVLLFIALWMLKRVEVIEIDRVLNFVVSLHVSEFLAASIRLFCNVANLCGTQWWQLSAKDLPKSSIFVVRCLLTFDVFHKSYLLSQFSMFSVLWRLSGVQVTKWMLSRFLILT